MIIEGMMDDGTTVLDEFDSISNRGFDDRADTPDSLGSLEDLDFLDVDAIDDNCMQNIIEEVMTMENLQNETTPQKSQGKLPLALLPKLTQAMLAPKRQTNSPVKIQFNGIQSYEIKGNDENAIPKLKVVLPPGLGKKLKAGKKPKANILKPKTTVYKKTVILSPSKLAILAPASAAEFYDVRTPKKRIKLDHSEDSNPIKEEKPVDFCGVITTKEDTASTHTKVAEVTKEIVDIKEEVLETVINVAEEIHPTIDNPRLFTDLLEHEATFIGDIDRTFETFEQLEIKATENEADEKHLGFMKRLDTWGPDKAPDYPFNGFYGVNSDLDEEDLGLPADWKDTELFSELDVRCKTESVFFNCWLPKFALKVRRDPYRNLLRTINKKDPEFNIVW